MGGVPVAGDGLQPEERHGGHSGTRRQEQGRTGESAGALCRRRAEIQGGLLPDRAHGELLLLCRPPD